MSANSNVVEIVVTGKDKTGDVFSNLRSLIAKFLAWLKDMFTKSGKDAGDGMADGLWRSADGRLRDLKGRFAKAGADAGAAAASGFIDMIIKMLASSGGFVGALASAGPWGIIALGLMAVAAAAAAAMAALILLAPAVLLVGGAFGAAATAGFGLAATIATMVIGLGGLGEAWTAHGQKSSGAGRASAAAAREVKAATDALTDAQKAALRAQEDVSRAREEEAERLEDLSRSLAGAHLSEESALLAVKRAQERVRESRKGGSGLDRAEAALGLREAQHQLEVVRDRVADLSKEKEEADRKGVEGSERVQGALERQAQAERALVDAAQRLRDARKGSGGGGGVDKFAEAMAKLSANGQALMTTLFALKPAFESLKKSVQDNLLAGMDVAVKNLATKWLPMLEPMLGGLAGNLNTMFKGLFDAISTPQFMTDIQFAVGGFGTSLERLGQGGEALLSAFGRLARASMPFWNKLVELIAGAFENFEKWIRSADESGELKSFMEDAAEALRQIWTIGGLVVKIVGDIIAILFPVSKEQGGTFLDGLEIGLKGLHEFLSDPATQQAIQDWIDGFLALAEVVMAALFTIAKWVENIDGWITTTSRFVDAVGAMPAKIRAASANMFDGIKDAFRAALNWIIDKWNGLSFTLPGFSMFGQQIGGGTISTKDIPRFFQGGIGGGLARVAERGRELIDTPGGMLLAMPHGSTVIPNGATESMLSGGGGAVQVQMVWDVRGGEAEFVRWFKKTVDRLGDGDVQKAFGKSRST